MNRNIRFSINSFTSGRFQPDGNAKQNACLVRKGDNSHQFSGDRHDLAHDLCLFVVSKLCRTIELLGVGMHNQGAIFNATTGAQI